VRVTLICGMAQQGKTTRALALLEREATRAICLDVVRSKALRGVPIAWASKTELAQYLVSPAAGGKWIGCLRSAVFTDYVWVLEAAPYLRHCTLLIDEALTFATAPESIEPFTYIARMNAHFGDGIGVPVVLTAQRPLDLPPDIRSQVTRIVSFRQREPRDLQWLAGFASPEFSAAIAELPEHESLEFPPSRHSTSEVSDEGRYPGRRRGSTAGAGGLPAVPEGELRGEDQAPDQVTAPARQEA
jgi:hypothetical protein